jgi:hypothetical protein
MSTPPQSPHPANAETKPDANSPRLCLKNRALSLMLKHNLENKQFAPSPEQITAWKARNLPTINRSSASPYELVLVAAVHDLETTAKFTDLYFENLRPQSLVIITKDAIGAKRLFPSDNVTVLDENEILDGLTYETIQQFNNRKTGWYFQQFLKMAYARLCTQNWYLIFDGDTVPVVPLQFLCGDNKGVFIQKGEYYEPYFNMLNKLFDGQVGRGVDFSFIAETMLVRRDIMLELVARIEANDKLPGTTFYEKILHSVTSAGLSGCDFSEYETYGNYVYTFHRDAYTARPIRSFREAMKFFGTIPERHILDYLSRDYETVSFEKKHCTETPLGVIEFINRCFKNRGAATDGD